MACSHIPTCTMFPLISVNSALKVWKAFYCEGKWTECARYKLSLEGKSVAANLLPNGKALELDKLAAAGATKAAPAAKPAAAAKPAVVRPVPAAAPAPAPAPRPAVASAPRPVASQNAAADGSTLSYYLRLQTDKTSGVMSDVIRILGGYRVRIDAVSEKRAREAGQPNHIIVLTDQVQTDDLRAAIAEIEAHPDVSGKVHQIPLEHLA